MLEKVDYGGKGMKNLKFTNRMSISKFINYKEQFINLVRLIGVITYGKERWLLQDNDYWYDRETGTYIDTNELQDRICDVINDLERNCH